jgi:hypothetical protein
MSRIGGWKKAAAIITLSSLFHLPVSIIAVSIGFGQAAERIEEDDNRRRRTGETSPSVTPTSERIFSGAFFLLLFPLIALILVLQTAGIDLWPRAPIIEYAPLILNSITWSLIVYGLYKFIARTVRNRRST